MKMHRIWITLSILVLAALACQIPGTAPAVPAAPALPPPTPVVAVQVPVTVDTAGQQETLVSLYERVLPGIVSIQVAGDQGGSLGSGFVYDDQGHILTNYHVVEGAKQLEVDFTSGYKIFGTVIGTDLDSDLAVVKVNAPASELHPLSLGDSNVLNVGQTVIAIGNPFGLSGTMTTGIISSLGRTLNSQREAPGGSFFTAGDIIQTDAAINPGNSGGPLLDSQGKVIGINSAIASESGTNSGVGFAIPVDILKRVVPELIAQGHYRHPWIGVTGRSISPEMVTAAELPVDTGVLVFEVEPGSPAEKAGVHGGDQQLVVSGLPMMVGGDILIAIDQVEVKRFDDMVNYLASHTSVGDLVTLTMVRAGSEVELSATLEERPGDR